MVPQPLQSSFQQSKWIWALAFGTALSLALTVTYGFALSSFTGRLGRLITASSNPSGAVIILRILSETTALLLGGLISFTFDIVVWTAASTRQGITIPTLLSLNAGTGIMGLFELLFWRNVGRHHLSVLIRYLAVMSYSYYRLLSLALIPIMGILIFSSSRIEKNLTKR